MDDENHNLSTLDSLGTLFRDRNIPNDQFVFNTLISDYNGRFILNFTVYCCFHHTYKMYICENSFL